MMTRRLAAPVLGLALGMACAIAIAQDNGADTGAASTSAASIRGFEAEHRTPDAVKKASARFDEVAKTYREAPTLTDEIDVAVTTPMGPQSEKVNLAFGKGSDMRLNVTGMKVISLDGQLYVVIDEIATDKYVGVPLKNGNMMETLESVAEGFSLPIPHMGFRYGKSPADAMETMAAGSLENIRIAGIRDVADGDQEILFQGDNGVGVLLVDGATSTIETYTVEFQPMGAPPGLTIALEFDFDTKIADELAEPITFDPGDRKKVASLEQMMQKLMEGDKAPTFTLKTSTGQEVSLESLEGKVVVLDMWATWCGPCRKGLPLVNDFARWAEENKLPVAVFGLNVWEDQERDAAKRLEQAGDFWKEQKFSFPTLFDLDDSVAGAYGPTGIPTTFIIDQKGRIAKVHTGYDPEMVETLKKEVQALLGATG